MKLYIAGSNQTECKQAAIALLDAEEITMADAVVLLESPDRIPGGKFVEAGIAIGQGKIVFNIGKPENMLMWHPQVWKCGSVDEFIRKVKIVNDNYNFSLRVDDSMYELLN